jgi:hypothetical protein
MNESWRKIISIEEYDENSVIITEKINLKDKDCPLIIFKGFNYAACQGKESKES